MRVGMGTLPPFFKRSFRFVNDVGINLVRSQETFFFKKRIVVPYFVFHKFKTNGSFIVTHRFFLKTTSMLLEKRKNEKKTKQKNDRFYERLTIQLF